MATKPTKTYIKAHKNFKYIKSSGGIREYNLERNGLRVLLKGQGSVPVVSVMVTYHVGSRNEALGYTGSTHLLEHLMFKGSKNFNNKKGNRLENVLIGKGAQLNATTWLDRTNYYEVIASEFLRDALAVEADRMRGAFLRESDRAMEMTVVRNEFERGENDPIEALDKDMWATAFQAHPYHHPTIGWRSDIENVPIARLKNFYDTFYWPNNATLSIIGHFDSNIILEDIYKYFGAVPRSTKPIPRVYTTEPLQQGARRVRVSRAGDTKVVAIAHKIPPALHQDSYALEILARVLGSGKSSRLYRRLVDTGKCISVDPFYVPMLDPGLFEFFAFLTKEADWAQVEKSILDEYESVQKNGVTKEEFNRAKSSVLMEDAMSRDGVFSVAGALNEAIAVGDWTFYTTFREKIEKVTQSQVKEVARKYLVEDQSTTGWFVPKK